MRVSKSRFVTEEDNNLAEYLLKLECISEEAEPSSFIDAALRILNSADLLCTQKPWTYFVKSWRGIPQDYPRQYTVAQALHEEIMLTALMDSRFEQAIQHSEAILMAQTQPYDAVVISAIAVKLECLLELEDVDRLAVFLDSIRDSKRFANCALPSTSHWTSC